MDTAEKIGKQYGVTGRTIKSGGQNAHRSKTAEQIAEEYGVSKATIERDAEFSKAVDKVAEKVGKEAKNYEIT